MSFSGVSFAGFCTLLFGFCCPNSVVVWCLVVGWTLLRLVAAAAERGMHFSEKKEEVVYLVTRCFNLQFQHLLSSLIPRVPLICNGFFFPPLDVFFFLEGKICTGANLEFFLLHFDILVCKATSD